MFTRKFWTPVRRSWSRSGEFEYIVAIVALIVLVIGLIVVISRRSDLSERVFLAFTTAVAAIAGHAVGGAGKRRAERRANRFKVATRDAHAAVTTDHDIERARELLADALDNDDDR